MIRSLLLAEGEKLRSKLTLTGPKNVVGAGGGGGEVKLLSITPKHYSVHKKS